MSAIQSTKNTINAQLKPNGFDAAVNVAKKGQKDFLRSIRFSLGWAVESSKVLKNVKPITLLMTGIKSAEEFLAFGEFFQATCKVGSSVTNALKDGITKSYSSLKASALEFIWNLFKVMKCLKNYGVFALKSTLYTPLMAVGGISFAVNATDRALVQIKEGNKVLNSKVVTNNTVKDALFRFFGFSDSAAARKKELARRDVILLCHLNKTAKNICIIAIGVIVTLRALIAFSAPGIVILTLGSLILITNTVASILEESYGLKKRFGEEGYELKNNPA